MKWEESFPDELDEVIEECPFAILPWGAREWHGPHDAVGLDTLKAYHMALDLSDEVGGVVMPPVYCGYQTMKPWKGFRHTLEFPRELIRELVFHHLEQLYDEGFLLILVLMGHYGGKHVETIQEAVEAFNGRHHLAEALAWQDYLPAQWVDVKGGDHAGKNETSLLMYYRPDLVDLSRLPPEGELSEAEYGFGGEDPRDSSADHGEKLVKTFLQQAVPKIREKLDELLKRRAEYEDQR